jgi:hypothetical protein
MKAVVAALLTFGAGLGCATTSVHPLTRRASFDFQCPQDQLRYMEIDRRSVGVAGCSKRATYIEACQGQGWNEECTWVLNGGIESTGPAQPSSGGPPGQTN